MMHVQCTYIHMYIHRCIQTYIHTYIQQGQNPYRPMEYSLYLLSFRVFSNKTHSSLINGYDAITITLIRSIINPQFNELRQVVRWSLCMYVHCTYCILPHTSAISVVYSFCQELPTHLIDMCWASKLPAILIGCSSLMYTVAL